MTAQFFSLADVAKIVTKRPHQVVYAITSGLIPDVVTRVAGKRVFTIEEVEFIKRHFATGPKKEDAK